MVFTPPEIERRLTQEVIVPDIRPVGRPAQRGGNTLIAAAGTEQEGDKKVEFAYDYVGRRVEKKVSTWDDVGQEWDLTMDRKFVWSGWLLLMELDGLNSDAVVRKYTWGLDLAVQNGSLNSLEAAGGIAGLLAMNEPVAAGPDLDYVYFYDANGNVGQLVDLGAATVQDAIVAHYEYDPYGNLTASAGTYADENPFRFSTKYFDAETGLYYFGYRYYSPGLGRFVSRDPIGERTAVVRAATPASGFIPRDPVGENTTFTRTLRTLRRAM